jgi:hypothetical protein
LLDELKGMGYRYKIASFCFEPACRSDAKWKGIDEDRGRITLFALTEPRAIAHEMGHGFHECLRRDNRLSDQFGEDYAEAIRWFVEQRMGPSTWCDRFWSGTRNRAVLDACGFEWDRFVARLQARQFYPGMAP